MPTKWLQERINGSKNEPGIPPHTAFCGSSAGWWQTRRRSSSRCALHPTPYALHPTPYTLHPAPYTLHPTPCTLHPTLYTLHSRMYSVMLICCWSAEGSAIWGSIRSIHTDASHYQSTLDAGYARCLCLESAFTGVRSTCGPSSPCSGRDCVKSIRSSYTGFDPQTCTAFGTRSVLGSRTLLIPTRSVT